MIFRILLIGWLSWSVLPAQTLLQRLAAPVRFQWGVEPEYQSNPLNLSDVEQDELASDPTILGTAETIDSGVLSGLLKIYYEPRLAGRFTTRFYLFNFYHYYSGMRDKNYASINFTAIQPLGNWRYVKSGYSYVPSYYLRHYKDADLNDGIRYACDYSTNRFWLAFEHRLGKKITLEYRGQMRSQYYNPHFTEYDVDIREGSLDVRFEPDQRWDFDLAGLYGWAQDVNRQDPKNRSYRSFEVMPGVAYSWSAGFLRRMTLDVTYRQREYLSEEKDDPLHNGRAQAETEVNLAAYPRTTGNFGWHIYGGYRQRRVESDFPKTVDLKSFQRWHLGVRFTFDTIWDIYL